MKPRPLLTPPQVENVDLLKKGSGDFVAMRRLAMRFRGILCGGSSVEKLEQWIVAARQSGIDAMQHFARRLLQDIDAVRNVVTERWSNGQTEGQISRLKTVKRSMYNRAGVELLRARMLPLSAIQLHQGGSSSICVDDRENATTQPRKATTPCTFKGARLGSSQRAEPCCCLIRPSSTQNGNEPHRLRKTHETRVAETSQPSSTCSVPTTRSSVPKAQ